MKHASFTPLCFSVDGLLGEEAETFLKIMADRLATKWDKSYSTIFHWIRMRIAFALLRATDLCIRGSRTRLKGLNMENGAGINPMNYADP